MLLCKIKCKGSALIPSLPFQASTHWTELEQEAASWQARVERRDEQAAAMEQQLAGLQAQVQQNSALAEV